MTMISCRCRWIHKQIYAAEQQISNNDTWRKFVLQLIQIANAVIMTRGRKLKWRESKWRGDFFFFLREKNKQEMRQMYSGKKMTTNNHKSSKSGELGFTPAGDADWAFVRDLWGAEWSVALHQPCKAPGVSLLSAWWQNGSKLKKKKAEMTASVRSDLMSQPKPLWLVLQHYADCIANQVDAYSGSSTVQLSRDRKREMIKEKSGGKKDETK